MIPTQDSEQVGAFLVRAREKYGDKAAEYCKKWIGETKLAKFNPDGLLSQWHDELYRDQIGAARRAGAVATNSEIRLHFDEAADEPTA